LEAAVRLAGSEVSGKKGDNRGGILSGAYFKFFSLREMLRIQKKN